MRDIKQYINRYKLVVAAVIVLAAVLLLGGIIGGSLTYDQESGDAAASAQRALPRVTDAV